MIDISILSSVDKEKIDKLKQRVENDLLPNMLNDPLLYYKFLKARDFNLDKAEKMLRKHIKWRKHQQISSFSEEFRPTEFFLKNIAPTTVGMDKEGDIVIYLPAGNLDGRDILKCIKLNDYEKHLSWFCENLQSRQIQKEKEGMKSQQITLIFDLKELTLSNATTKASADIVLREMNVLQDNYPETVKTIDVINAPIYYVIIYNLLKPLMSATFLKKVHIYSHSGWKEEFLKTIDAEVLPAFMGGKRTDPDGDPLCKTFINHGGPIPMCYYLTDEERGFKDKSDVSKILVSAGSKKDVHFDVTDVGSVIRWEFLVRDKDIGIGLFFQGLDNDVEILPIQKYDTMDGVEIGSYTAKCIGKYFISFDNSYSWLSSKEIEYCITVLKN